MTRIRSNEPCPCGSGKKYKRCCGKKTAPLESALGAGYRHCNDLAEEAKRLDEEGACEAAVKVAQIVVKRDHRCAAWELCGHMVTDALLDQFRLAEAAELATALTQTNPACPQGRFQLGRVKQLMGEAADSLPLLVESIREMERLWGESTVTVAHVHLAEASSTAQRLDVLDPFLERWKAKPPGDRHSRFFLAIVLYEAGRVPEAERTLRTLQSSIANTPPLDDAILFELGLCAHRLGRVDEAREYLLASSRCTTARRALVFSTLAAVEMEAGRGDDAVRWARRAVDEAPFDIGYRINLAGGLAVADRFAEAVSEYDRVLAAVPSHRGVQLSRAFALCRIPRPDDAVNALRRLEREGYEEELVGVNLGVALAYRGGPGDFEDALARHKRALQKSREAEPRAVLVLNMMAIHAQLGHFDEALALAEGVTEDWPTWARAEVKERRVALESRRKEKIIADAVRLLGERGPELAALFFRHRAGNLRGCPTGFLANSIGWC